METSDLKILFYILNLIPAMMLIVIANRFYAISRASKHIHDLSRELLETAIGGAVIFLFEIIAMAMSWPYIQVHIICSLVAIAAFYPLFKRVS